MSLIKFMDDVSLFILNKNCNEFVTLNTDTMVPRQYNLNSPIKPLDVSFIDENILVYFDHHVNVFSKRCLDSTATPVLKNRP